MNDKDNIMGGIIPNMEKKKRRKEIERKIKIILSKDLSRNYSFTQTYADLFIEKLDEMIASVKMIKRKKFVCPLPFVHSDTDVEENINPPLGYLEIKSKKEERAIDFLNKLGLNNGREEEE